ncbi:MAG: DUF3168 domain-containing protein [Parvibaculaceae bacterium]|nr:DUF3168 domain-containing protein [Parvibaculaceae bacterium]
MTARVKDYSLPLRKALVTKLQGTAALTALVPAARIYGERAPASDLTWPFIRMGSIILTPERHDCYEGATHEVTIHAFSKESQADQIYRIREQVIAALDDADLTILGDGGVTNMVHTASNLIPDPEEANAYHDIHDFMVSVERKL